MTQANTTNRNTGMILLGIGALFLLGNFAGGLLEWLLWPMWILGPGAALLYLAYAQRNGHPGIAIPGTVITTTGAILFLTNLTNQWEAWSYLWAAYPMAIGLSLYYSGKMRDENGMAKGGEATARTGLYLLIGFGLFFELIIFGGLGFLFSPITGIVLVALGLMLATGRVSLPSMGGSAQSKRKNDDARDPETGIDPALRLRMDEALAEDGTDRATA